MAISVVMPALEMAQETGKLISWLKKEGDAVSKGEMLLEIETDKAVMEVESPGDGILAGIRVQAGTEVPVGKTIAWIVKPGEQPPTEESQTVTGRRTDFSKETAAVPLPDLPSAKATAQDVRISPKARRLAKEHGIDLTTVKGSGPGGEILASDILAAKPAAGPHGPTASRQAELSPVARLMAERTTQSWTTVPHFFVIREIDATNLNAAREALLRQVQASHSAKLTHTDLLIVAVAKTLARHPRINSSWVNNNIRPNADINVAIAMAVDDGVVTAVIQKADQLSLGEIASQRQALAERARAGRLRPADIAGGTFTVSNLGMLNVDSFSAIITPPQAAILAVGRIVERVIAYEGHPAVRPTLSLTLSSDHRVIDGAHAAKFMNDLALTLEAPPE